jgi:hypothetical protein
MGDAGWGGQRALVAVAVTVVAVGGAVGVIVVGLDEADPARVPDRASAAPVIPALTTPERKPRAPIPEPAADHAAKRSRATASQSSADRRSDSTSTRSSSPWNMRP